MLHNSYLHESVKIVRGFTPVATGSNSGDWVSLKGASVCQVQLWITNATTVTGSAVTFQQATAVAGTGAKALTFPAIYWKNEDLAAADTLVEVTGASSLTTLTTNSKQLLYIFEIKPTDLDVANNFDCIQIVTASGVAHTDCAIYCLYPAKYAGSPNPLPSAILD